MDRKDVDKIGLGKHEFTNIATGKPTDIAVTGLPDHLEAKIVGAYRYRLSRKGDIFKYEQNQPSPTAEGALQALKNLLNWDAA